MIMSGLTGQILETVPIAVARSSRGKPSDHAERLLLVFELIAKLGPIGLEGLTCASLLPRVSVWRAANSLRAWGWVRMRRCDGCFEVTSHFNALADQMHVAEKEASIFDNIVKTESVFSKVHISLGVLTRFGSFEIIDSTRRKRFSELKYSLVFDILPLAALSVCTSNEIAKHLLAYAKYGTKDEVHSISSGEALAEVLKIKKSGIAISQDKVSASVAHRFSSGLPGAIEIFQKSDSKRDRNSFLEALSNLQAESTDFWLTS